MSRRVPAECGKLADRRLIGQFTCPYRVAMEISKRCVAVHERDDHTVVPFAANCLNCCCA